jgi:hypothetical protein
MQHFRSLRRSRRRRYVLAGVAFAFLLSQPGVASAEVATDDYQRSEITIAPPLSGAYEYSKGSVAYWASTAEFDAGSHAGTSAQDATDRLTLSRIGPSGVAAPDPANPWWDPDWGTRQCYEVKHPGATSVTEYPLAIGFPLDSLVAAGLLQADYGDLRAIAADGVTELPLWAETAYQQVWVQVDAIDAGSSTSFCLYYAYAPGDAAVPVNHGEGPVFTYTTEKPIYYTVQSSYTGSQSVTIASYVPNNTIVRDTGGSTASLTLGDGEMGMIGGNSAATVYRVRGPIASRGSGSGHDTLVPISWAGTRFVIPSYRNATPAQQQRISFYAPFSDTSIEIYGGTDPLPLTTQKLAAGTAGSWLEDPMDAIDVGESVVVISTAPILLYHTTDNGEDAFPVHPLTGQDLYGISSTARVGFEGSPLGGPATSANILRSNGASATVSGGRGDQIDLPGSPAGGGVADGLRVRLGSGPSNAGVAAISQGDGTGRDATTFLPVRELGSRYLIVENSSYIAVACPSPSVDLTVIQGSGTTSSFTCSGSGVGHGKDTVARSTGGSRAIEIMSGGEPFYASFDPAATAGETNLLGMKQGRQYVYPAPRAGLVSTEGLLADRGLWESQTIDTGAGSEVFGTMDFSVDQPDGTEVSIQIATGDVDPPTIFLGPDGTTKSYWTAGSLPSVADFIHDGDRYLRVRVQLATDDRIATTPSLDRVAVEYHLPPLARKPGSPGRVLVAGVTTPDVTTQYLLRMRTEEASITGSTATALFLGGAGLEDLDTGVVRLVDPRRGLDSVQWANGGAVDGPVAFDDLRPHSIVLDQAAFGSGTTTIEFTWQLNVDREGSIFAENDFVIEVTTP